MEQDAIDLKQQPDPIDEKLQDTAALEKIFKQAVFEAVDKAQKLGFLPIPPQPKSGS
ncbi:MAG: hypothetical protein ABI575_06885 [Oxalobacteraceae bacterium]